MMIAIEQIDWKRLGISLSQILFNFLLSLAIADIVPDPAVYIKVKYLYSSDLAIYIALTLLFLFGTFWYFQQTVGPDLYLRDLIIVRCGYKKYLEIITIKYFWFVFIFVIGSLLSDLIIVHQCFLGLIFLNAIFMILAWSVFLVLIKSHDWLYIFSTAFMWMIRVIAVFFISL